MNFELIASTADNAFPRHPVRRQIRRYKTFRSAKQALRWAESQFLFSKEYYELYLDREFWKQWEAPEVKPTRALPHIGKYSSKLDWTHYGNRS